MIDFMLFVWNYDNIAFYHECTLDDQFKQLTGCCLPWNEYILYEYCFMSLSAQSWQYRDRRKSKAGTMPYSHFE